MDACKYNNRNDKRKRRYIILNKDIAALHIWSAVGYGGSMKVFRGLFILLAMMCLTACGKEDLGDTYVEGKDHQYMWEAYDSWSQTKARGENGYFFLQGKYVYYLPDGADSLVPLCNKVDCMHTAEVDADKYAMCDAYFTGEDGWDGIAYYDGYLYLMCRELEVEPCQRLYRIKEDGSGKELVYEWKGWTIEEWCLHRGEFFYVEHIYYEDQETQESVEQLSVKKIPVEKILMITPELVYEAPEGITLAMLTKLDAYGNYLYFSATGSTGTAEDLMDENAWLEFFYSELVAVNLSTGEQSIVVVPGADSGVSIQYVTFWQDKLVYLGYNHIDEMGIYGEMDIYMAELDGTNPHVILEDVAQGTRILTDDKYMYLTNTAFVIHGDEEKQMYQVYDKELRLIDTMGIPYRIPDDGAIGDADGLYFFKQKAEDDIALVYFDKSTIGTYQGNDFIYEDVAEWKYANADLED